MNIPVLSDALDRLRARSEYQSYQRFLDRPFASVQLLLAAGAGLLGLGILMAVSTSIAAAHDTSTATPPGIWSQVIKEGMFLALGLPVFWVAMCLPPRAYRILVYPILAIALGGLLAVFVPGVGVEINGAHRWLNLGPLQLQPSEFAKFAFLLWGADLLARKQQLGMLRRTRHLFVPLLPGFLLVVAMVMLEPDLGTTCCLIMILLGLLWMIGMPMRYFMGVVVVIVVGVLALALAAPYRWQRVTTFLHPFQDVKTTGYHTVEGLYAIASGGFFGVGLGQGTSKYGWVPNANSDYVFAIVGEEMGLLGCALVLALFGFFAYTGLRVSRRSVDPFVRLVAGASTIWICGQAIINIGYVTGLLPVTGIPLPFISAGGTSLLVSFLVLGMLVSFARHEAPAVAEVRRAIRAGRLSRMQRWLRIPVPRAYVPPKRRRPAEPQRRPAAQPRATQPRATQPRATQAPAARARTAAPRTTTALRATGTEGRRR